MAGAQVRRLRLWQNRVETAVEIAGSGPPLVYLHGPWGLAPDRAFVARLVFVCRGDAFGRDDVEVRLAEAVEHLL